MNDAEQRQGHGKENALLHANENNNRSGRDRQHEFTGALAADDAESTQIDETRSDSEHDCAKHTMRKKLQRTGEEKKDPGPSPGPAWSSIGSVQHSATPTPIVFLRKRGCWLPRRLHHCTG